MQEEIWIHFGYQSVQSSLLNELYRYDRISCYYFGKSIFITDFRYTEQAAAQAQGFEIIKMSDLFLMR